MGLNCSLELDALVLRGSTAQAFSTAGLDRSSVGVGATLVVLVQDFDASIATAASATTDFQLVLVELSMVTLAFGRRWTALESVTNAWGTKALGRNCSHTDKSQSEDQQDTHFVSGS